MITHAAVVPLNYGPGHLEYNIILVGNHYDDLVRLLTDPQSVLFAERTSHRCPGGIPPRFDDWTNQSFPYDPMLLETIFPPTFWLEAPITALISHGLRMSKQYSSRDSDPDVVVHGFREDGAVGAASHLDGLSTAMLMAALALDHLTSDGVDTGESEHLAAVREHFSIERMDSTRKAKLTDQEVAALAQSFNRLLYPNGGFYAEFAVATRTLNIVYFRSRLGRGSYSGDITDVTLSKPTVSVGLGGSSPLKYQLQPRGTVHFDLVPKSPLAGPANPSLRAEFVGQLLERPWLALRLAKDRGYYLEAEPRFALRGRKYLTIEPTTYRKEPVPIDLDSEVFPDIVVDGLSTGPVGDEAQVEPCTVLEWREVPPGSGNYMWVKVIVKVYEDRVPPPEILAQQGPGSPRLVSWELFARSGNSERPIRKPETDHMDSVPAESSDPPRPTSDPPAETSQE